MKAILIAMDTLPTELFDRRVDPREKRNLAVVEEEIWDRLELQYYRWLEGVLGNRPDPIGVEASKGILLSHRVRVSMNEFGAHRQAS